VDDGSPDNSGEILDRYAAKHVNIRAIHKENGGVTSARLRSVQEASGEWIGFVDGDDEIEPDMYARLLKNAVEYDADISHCGYQMVFSDGRVNYFHNSGIIREQDSHTAIRDLLEGTCVEPGLCNKFYRRELFQGLSRRMDPTIRMNEDLLMNYYLFSASEKAVFEDWCPYHYIVREGSASRAKMNEHKIYDPIKVKEIILADASEVLRPDAVRALVNTCIYTYCGTVFDGSELSNQAAKDLRWTIAAHRSALSALPKRTRLLGELILRTPRIFRLLYPVYVRLFQKSKYR
jgi:glycosyltransferase involved in cell wall biosynthesis